MQVIRLFHLHFINILQYRARQFVWFLIALLNPLLLILFWQGTGKNSPALISYYLLLIIANTFMAHVEEDVAELDIKNGDLTKYLLKPYSYYWLRFYGECTWRLSGAFYGVIAFGLLSIIYSNSIILTSDPLKLLLAITMALVAFFVSFTYKMILGMMAFWLLDIKGLFQVSDIIIITLAGYIMPIILMPTWIATIANLLPFAYIIYYPIAAFSNQLSVFQELRVILIQLIWLLIFATMYQFVWKAGIKKFSAIGQ